MLGFTRPGLFEGSVSTMPSLCYGRGVTGVTELLDDAKYLEFLAATHPGLRISPTRFDVPVFIGPLDVREPMLPGGVTRKLADLASKFAPTALLHPQAFFVGTPFERYDQTHVLDAITAPEPTLRAFEDAARTENCELVVLTNVDPDHPRVKEWLALGAKTLPSFPDTLIDVVSSTFADHLAQLPGEDRSGIRRNIRKFDDKGHQLERLVDTGAEARELFACYRPYFDDATVQWFPHTEAYFAGVGLLDPRVHMTVARTASGRLIGFIINFVDGTGFQAGRIGVHPDFHRKDAVYFRLIYWAIEETIATGGGLLSLEPTGYRMKRHLGARAKPLVNLCFGVSTTWKILLGAFSGVGAMLLSHLDGPPTLEKKY